MDASISPRAHAIPYRAIGYWVATAVIVAELAVGGVWDIARIDLVREVITHLGYPTYFLILLGIWKILGAAAIIAPRDRW
ncbi:DoxX family protein [Nocardia pseudobrasiliensis]|uniref:DoxX-like protein n=1 Tax=Nocardia pseudobrasiliensis TaxID=45979 RepID=A0A370ICY4_9NOCA|nr:DoxX family protein [Nocardia pseudobrasiliensis]RDI68568.1 DoxX-like protein [Nocardia pseudobrasiliensis]